MKALIIEDSVFYQELLYAFLSKRGYECSVANDGAIGLDAFENETFDLVMLDINLPDMCGWDIIGDLMEMQPKAKILPITGHLSVNGRNESPLSEGRFYIAKPFMDDDLDDYFEDLQLPTLKKDDAMLSQNTLPADHKIPELVDQVGAELCTKLLGMFKLEVMDKVPQFMTLLREEKHSDIESYAHQLKSNSRYFGFLKFGDLCGEIEYKIVKNEYDHLDGLIDQLSSQIESVVTAIDLAQKEFEQMTDLAS